MSLTETERRLLARWAAGCAIDVLNIFEESNPVDKRPSIAAKAASAWGRGEISMEEALKASSDAHAAARVANSEAARQAARAAGQAAATAHAIPHARLAAHYARKAVFNLDPTHPQINDAIYLEWAWQYGMCPKHVRNEMFPNASE